MAGAAGGEGAGIPGAAERWISSSEACEHIRGLPGGSLRHRRAPEMAGTRLKMATGNEAILHRNPSCDNFCSGTSQE